MGPSSLETETENRFLKPGETATFNRKTLTLKVEKDDVHFASSWANTQLVFRNRSLGDICKLLSKWYRVKIDVDPTLSNNISIRLRCVANRWTKYSASCTHPTYEIYLNERE